MIEQESWPATLGSTMACDRWVVFALLHTADGRYLLQLRDDKPDLSLRGHWALFGGAIEPGETPDQALKREIEEELAFKPPVAHLFSECIHALPRKRARTVRMTFFAVPITDADVDTMILHEGTDMRLFDVDAVLMLPRISPWGLAAILMHARHATVFA